MTKRQPPTRQGRTHLSLTGRRGTASAPDTPSNTPPRPAGSWKRPTLAGFVVIALAFGAGGIWAATAPLDSAVRAPGKVAVESNRKVVEHIDGGTVAEVLVDAGEHVDRGQLLVRLDDEEARARFLAVRSQLDNALARQARLITERDGDAKIEFPKTLIRRSNTQRVAKAMAGERDQLAERRQALDAKVRIQRQRISELETRISGLEAQRTSVRDQVGIMRDELSGLREIMEKGYYPRIQVLKRERELKRLVGRRGDLTAKMAQTRERIGEAELRIRRARQQLREQVAANLRETQNRIDELRQRLTEARARLDRKNILAQFAGTVHDLKVRSKGAVVKPGGQILQIVPQNDSLIVEARVAPRDIDLVSTGMSADVRMTAFSGSTTPTLSGSVVTVSPGRLQNQDSGRSYYSARIDVPAQELRKLGDRTLKVGMPAQVMIRTGAQTLIDYLWKPISDALSRGMIEK